MSATTSVYRLRAYAGRLEKALRECDPVKAAQVIGTRDEVERQEDALRRMDVVSWVPNVDEVVARKVMGFAYSECRMAEEDVWISDDRQLWFQLPPYSTNMDASWTVLEKMSDKFPLWQLGALVTLGEPSPNTAYCQFAPAWPPTWIRAEAQTAPLAICLAALRAVCISSDTEGQT